MDFRTNVTEMQDFRTDDIIEFLRVTEINKLGRLNQRRDLAGIAIMSGASVEQFKSELRSAIVPENRAPTEVGFSAKEIQQYSLLRHALHIAADPVRKTHGTLESEASDAIAKKLGRMPSPGGFFVPQEILHRDLGVAVASAGGHLVGTTNVSFIELLRNRSVLLSMGARRLTGLQGDALIPRQTVAATPVWLSTEISTLTESQQTFAQVALSPKTVGGYIEISGLLRRQSNPSTEGLVMADLAAIIAVGIDFAGLNGSGAAGQPIGIVNTAGIGGVTGTSIALAGILEFQTDLGNALTPSCGYVTTQAIASLLAQRQKAASTSSFLWEGSVLDGSLGGFRAMSSAQIPTGSLLFGDFGQVVIGEWGELEIVADPYTKFITGIVGIRGIFSADVVVRQPSAFSLATSVT